MTSMLNPNEKDLLQRIIKKEELRPHFFRKAKGLKWFEDLEEQGFFNPSLNPKPAPAKKEGHFYIPYWSVLDYLEKTSLELNDDESGIYPKKYISLIEKITTYSRENGISNYRTWWKFSQIIQNIPIDLIELEFIEIIDFWLCDKYENNLVAQELGEKWLPKLLDSTEEHPLALAEGILRILYKVEFTEREFAFGEKKEGTFRYDNYWAKEISEKIAYLSGKKLGIKAVQLFDGYLKELLDKLEKDIWSSIWQPAIEDHPQNKYRDDAENIIIRTYRESLMGVIEESQDEVSPFVEVMLNSDYKTIQRIALYIVSQNIELFRDYTSTLIDSEYFTGSYQHEMWHFLKTCYQYFSPEDKESVLKIISDIELSNDEGEIRAGATAYKKNIWLSAIKEYGEKETLLYEQNKTVTKVDPDHPDFSSYSTIRTGGPDSPLSLEEMRSLSVDGLITYLRDYRDSKSFDGPGIEGLVRVFKQYVKDMSLDVFQKFSRFVPLDLAYSYEILEAFRDLWEDKATLPWADIWRELLNFCLDLMHKDDFWESDSGEPKDSLVANRKWIVSSIGRLIASGTRSDEHAFEPEFLPIAESIVSELLDKVEGESFELDNDALTRAINSPRGICIEALINMVLRSCRLEDKENQNHNNAWSYFQHYFDKELDNTSSDDPMYEFCPLIVNYLSNFFYMSRKWIMENLTRIFDQDHYEKWLFAMHGYSYLRHVHQEIFDYLKGHNDYLKVLDDPNVIDIVLEKVIQHIVIAYINDFETLENDSSLMKILIDRKNEKEINHVIRTLWSFRVEKSEKVSKKVFEVWPLIIDKLDYSNTLDQKIASELCSWADFIDEVNEGTSHLLLSIAPYADVDYNSYHFIKKIAKISVRQPLEALEIWKRMLGYSFPVFPEEAIREIVNNSIENGSEEKRELNEIDDEYLKNGIDLIFRIRRDLKENPS